MFGINQALESRYTTPALMAWLSLFIISAPYLQRYSSAVVNRGVLVALILMLPMQAKALKSKSDLLFERNIAALALELEIMDAKQIAVLYPNAEWIIPIARAAEERKLSIFGQEPFINLKNELGIAKNLEHMDPSGACLLRISDQEAIESAPDLARLQGTISMPNLGKENILRLADGAGKIVGFAYCERRDTMKNNGVTDLCFFKAYVYSYTKIANLGCFKS